MEIPSNMYFVAVRWTQFVCNVTLTCSNSFLRMESVAVPLYGLQVGKFGKKETIDNLIKTFSNKISQRRYPLHENNIVNIQKP